MELEKFERISIPTENLPKKINYFGKVWVWKKLFESRNFNELDFYICFTNEFPLCYPRIYLTADSLQKLEYIPHVSISNGFICTFDSKNYPRYGADPENIVFDSMMKAKEIINKGLNDKNLNDINQEFLAYWNQEYDEKPIEKVIAWQELGLMNDEKLKMSEVRNKIANSKCILHSANDESFKNYLKETNNAIEKSLDAYYIGLLDFDLLPPFTITNKCVSKMLSQNNNILYKVKKYFNSCKTPIIVFAKKINRSSCLIGWMHKCFQNKRNGFRKEIDNFSLLSMHQSRDKVRRISFEKLSSQRLNIRTIGEEKSDNFSFAIAGLGSIGSNFLHFLKACSTEFTLIDKEALKIENIKRHYLGLNYANMNKAEALKKHLLSNDPNQKINAYTSSIIEIVKNQLCILEEKDYFFLCLGEYNLERYISELFSQNKLNIPTVHIWVEPYLAGGHCLYIPPNTRTYGDFFEDDSYYRYNVIDKQEYICKNDLLNLRETGCQSIYTPYGQLDITLFLSKIFPIVYALCANKCSEAKAITWIGNLKLIESKQIKTSEFIAGKPINEAIICNEEI
ncbi:MAG: hypothetical protein GY730_07775 [bacterium]|nr:hypothetical protein [bacterium]